MIYLDNAATSWPKPPKVSEEMCRAVEEYGANPGRGSHFLSRRAEEVVYNCRSEVAKLFGAKAENVVFTQNATHGLNIAILGSVNINDHVIISDIEHNSVYRPVVSIGCDYSILKTSENNDSVTLANLQKLIRKNTKAVIITAAGNLTGQRLPIKEIGELLKEKEIVFIVDASQGAGHFNINMEENNIDILCAPGHKGLLGPQGSGIMVLRNKFPAPLIFGGTGSMSALKTMPPTPPERYEAGTLNTPAIAGLLRGVEFINEVGIKNIEAHEKKLSACLYKELQAMENINILGGFPRGGLVAFNIKDKPSEIVAAQLSNFGILVRAGLHCSPLAHKKYGTSEQGAVRISFGCFNCFGHVKKIAQVIKKLI